MSPAGERLVGQDGHILDTDRPQRTGIRSEPIADLVRPRSTEFGIAGDGPELRLIQLMIAAQHHQQRLPVRNQDQALHLRGLGQPGKLRYLRDGLPARRVKLLRRHVAFGVGGQGSRWHRRGLLQVGRVTAPLANCNQIFARFRRHHELVRLAAAHCARVGLHYHVLQPAAIENAAVRPIVFLVGCVQPRLVYIEGIGILHDELAHPQQPRFRSRLVAEFGLNLVPDLRKLLVTAQFSSGDRSHHLFMGHTQAQIAPEAVFQPEHVFAHHVPAARLLPDFRRIQRGQQHLLRAHAVHLFPHNLLDLE